MSILTLEQRITRLEKLIKNEADAGAEVVYQDDNWTVYQITDYTAAKKYSTRTNWGLGGRAGEIDPDFSGPEYFDRVAKSNKIYYYINNAKKSNKYCILVKRGKPVAIFDNETEDVEPKFMLTYEPTFPSIKGIFVPPKQKGDITKLCKAISKGDIETVKKALGQGTNLEEVGPGGATPLYLAVRERNHDIVKLLLDAGADPDGTGGRSAMYAPMFSAADIAKFKGDDRFVKLLKKYGSKINPK